MLYHQRKGRYESEYQALWDDLVPQQGQAETIQGELVRVIGRLDSEYYRNGNANWDMGFRLYTNFLFKHLRDEKIFDAETRRQIEADIEQIRSFSKLGNMIYEEGEDAFDRITDRVVEWCQQHPELIPKEHNPKLKR